jgi:hypothetical protein
MSTRSANMMTVALVRSASNLDTTKATQSNSAGSQ